MVRAKFCHLVHIPFLTGIDRCQISAVIEHVNCTRHITGVPVAEVKGGQIRAETEHTRQELNNKIIDFMSNELEPIKKSIKDNQNDIAELKDDITQLRLDIVERDKEREVNDAKKFDRFKIILAAVIGVLGGISTLSLWLEPLIRTLINVFF